MCLAVNRLDMKSDSKNLSYCCGASEPEASERSSSLICAERGFRTKFYLAHGIVVVRAFYAQNTNFKLARVFEFLSNF